MTRQVYPHVVALLALGPVVQVCGYSEEDWRAYSRTQIALVDSVVLQGAAAGPLAVVGESLACLAADRSTLVYLDKTSLTTISSQRLESGWNLDVRAIAAFGSRIYLLSGTTQQVYRCDGFTTLSPQHVVLDLGSCRFNGDLAMDVLAMDSSRAYVLVEAGFATHIACVSDGKQDAGLVQYVPGRPVAVCLANGIMYCATHRSVGDSSPVLRAYSLHSADRAGIGGKLLSIEMPCPRVCCIAVDGKDVWAVGSTGRVLYHMRLLG
jgi:hypothetical protein